MVTFEQIQLLESKVRQAVDLIASLREENGALRKTLSSYEKRIEELEVLIDSFKRDQGKIEEGIISALQQLDALESSAVEVQQHDGEATSTAEAPIEETEGESLQPDIAEPDIAESEDAEEPAPDRNGELDIF
ncbi:cell division protein ZapB [Sediminispirochaeta bajacaliforniensis]|uniref:cell division protein ZapB n=1 Tax=Sediminispirochaeta bajacaliforniensis TaxID=148 RepID=UPI0003721FEB|nr:cell division protein ZapB [Sediminispirochaeta bajacaliforniensis]